MSVSLCSECSLAIDILCSSIFFSNECFISDICFVSSSFRGDRSSSFLGVKIRSLVIWRMHKVLQARQLILITRFRDEGCVHGICLLVGQLLDLLDRLHVVALREEINQFASQLVHKVCTVHPGCVLIHHANHVWGGKVNTICDSQGPVLLILFYDALVLRYARKA